MTVACNGNIGNPAPTGSGGNSGPRREAASTPGDVTVPPAPISPEVATIAVRKVKNLLIGMAPTDEDIALVTSTGAAGLQQLISTWQTTDPFKICSRTR